MNRNLRRRHARLKQRRKSNLLKRFLRNINWWSSEEIKKYPLCYFLMTTPSKWTKQMMIQPSRVRSHQMERNVEKGVDPDILNWPSYRRPHIYYW